jgi:hypothetical protein
MAFLPNRHTLLRELGYDEADLAQPAGNRLVNALIAHGDADHITHRVQEHLDAGADHVALHILTADPNALPTQQWRELANREG